MLLALARCSNALFVRFGAFAATATEKRIRRDRIPVEGGPTLALHLRRFLDRKAVREDSVVQNRHDLARRTAASGASACWGAASSTATAGMCHRDCPTNIEGKTGGRKHHLPRSNPRCPTHIACQRRSYASRMPARLINPRRTPLAFLPRSTASIVRFGGFIATDTEKRIRRDRIPVEGGPTSGASAAPHR